MSAAGTVLPSDDNTPHHPVIPSLSRNLFRVNETAGKDPSTALRSAQDDRGEGKRIGPTEEKAALCIPTGHLGKLSPEVTDELFI